VNVVYVVSYPRKAVVGGRYRLEVGIEVAGGEWPFDEEEYPLSVYVDPGRGFTCAPWQEGGGRLVLRRGGTDAPAQFVLTAERAVTRNMLRVSLVNRAGSTIAVLKYDDVVVE
jgi:hypothetical protein